MTVLDPDYRRLLSACTALFLVGALMACASGRGALPTLGEKDADKFLFDRGTVYTDRGETLRLLGREDEALPAFDEAIGLFDQKGDLVSAERVRRIRAEAVP